MPQSPHDSIAPDGCQISGKLSKNQPVRSRKYIYGFSRLKISIFSTANVLGNRSMCLSLLSISSRTYFPIASTLRSEGICLKNCDFPSTQLYCCRKRYLPFPCPVTGSMTPCSTISFRRSEALDTLRSIAFITSDRPKIVCPGNASRSFKIWLAVFG